MNKLAIIPILLIVMGAGAVAYGIIQSVTYNVTVHNVAPLPAANIQITSGTTINVDINEGETTTKTITLQNIGDATGSATLSITSNIAAHFTDGTMTKTVGPLAPGDTATVDVIIGPHTVTVDTTYTVTVSVN